jgi:hypothetical protein
MKGVRNDADDNNDTQLNPPKTCRCGSRTHLRISHGDCPLNTPLNRGGVEKANSVAPSAVETELAIESRGTPHQPMRQPVSPLTVQQVATKQPQSISPLQPAMQTMQVAEASTQQNEVRRL